MLLYIPEDKEVKRKKLPPEYQVKQKLFVVTFKRFIALGRFELSVLLLIIIFALINEFFFVHLFFNYIAILLNPLSLYAYVRVPLLINYYINDKHNEVEVDFEENIMYFKSGRTVRFSEIEEVELHKGGLFPDVMPTFYQPFERYRYIGIILKSGEQFIITRMLMEKFVNFPVEFKFFRDPYPMIRPTKI